MIDLSDLDSWQPAKAGGLDLSDLDSFKPKSATLRANASGSAGAVNKKAEAIWGGSFDDWKKRKEADDAERARIVAESEAGNVGSRRAQEFQRQTAALNEAGLQRGEIDAGATGEMMRANAEKVMATGDLAGASEIANQALLVAPEDAQVQDLLKRSVRPGMRVLDPFCGTGPVFPAAHSLSAIATGVELDAAAYGIAAQRIQKLGGTA